MSDVQAVFIQLSAVVQILFTIFAGIDAMWFHFWRLRLHARRETRSEHLLHTMNACLFPCTVYFLWCGNFAGWALWAGIAATAATFVLEFLDVGHERSTRAIFGGLSSTEAVMHFGMGVARALAFAFVLAAKPLEAFSVGSPAVLATAYPEWVPWMGRLMFLSSLPMAALHVALCFPAAAPGRKGVARGHG